MDQAVRIRMYNVGFGDCFLLFLPGPEGTKKILIDCGSIKQGGHSIAKVAGQVIADIKDEDGVPRLDVLVLSHRHNDHLSGFDAQRWKDVKVGEVWMPWVESPTDPDARQIRKVQDAAARSLRVASTLLLEESIAETILEISANATDGADNLEYLKSGFVEKPRYLPVGRRPVEAVEAPLLPGVKVYAMGPPRDRDALKNPDPPTGETLLSGYTETWMGHADAPKFQPFGSDWVIDPPTVRLHDERELQDAASMADLFELAAAELDADINNTSLILMFKVGSHYLLFPGDAQWGPWEELLNDEDAVDLLKKTTFIKISHHASHNGSPATLMREVLGHENSQHGRVYAMISVKPRGTWPIPHEPVMTLLEEQNSPYIRSDKFEPQASFTRKRDIWYELELPL